MINLANKFLAVFGLVVLIIACFLVFDVYGEVDKTSTVTRIVDGDTFDIATGERIRLADVDCPEYYESGYSEASDYLSSLIYGKTVYLDVDDVYTYDYSGTGSRLVCVAYVDYNSTHLLNVNKALLDSGHAVISNFYNEFNPNLWTLYSLNPIPEPTPTPTPTPIPTATPSPESTQSPSPTVSPTPTPTSDLDEFSKVVTALAVSISAIVFVIVIFALINKKGKK